MFRRAPLLVTFVAAVVGAAACTGSGATTAPAPATVAPAPATAAPGSAAAPSAAAGGATVNAQSVGSAGTILVDGASGMTLYNFTKDTKDSGKSVCSGGCLETWPALTVAAGGTPTGGDGVTGTLATITRDDGTLQVTYNGLPLYFFKNDKAPGDLNGVYENWVTVKP
jgi:predicted lipoprotein with Yx(FWY)xxD motif